MHHAVDRQLRVGQEAYHLSGSPNPSTITTPAPADRSVNGSAGEPTTRPDRRRTTRRFARRLAGLAPGTGGLDRMATSSAPQHGAPRVRSDVQTAEVGERAVRRLGRSASRGRSMPARPPSGKRSPGWSEAIRANRGSHTRPGSTSNTPSTRTTRPSGGHSGSSPTASSQAGFRHRTSRR